MITLMAFRAEIAAQLRVWGYVVTGATNYNPRTARRDAAIAALVECRDVELAGWWDHDVASLWHIRVDRGLGTDRPPFWFALAGLSWAERGWWLTDEIEAGLL